MSIFGKAGILVSHVYKGLSSRPVHWPHYTALEAIALTQEELLLDLTIMIISSILCFAASAAALTLDVASSGGNKSSSLLYGLLYEVS
jgi:hypothetical protein